LQLSSLGKASKMDALLYAPFTLHKGMIKRIRAEKEAAEQGKPARIIAKMNALYDEELVNELYGASQSGVQIDLIVRGVCQLRPGVEGLSENIRVRSIIGRFLEHSRVFYFENNGNPELWCSSADWMSRNMFHRVETCFPIRQKRIRDRILEDLHLYLADNTHAWILQESGSYEILSPQEGEEAIDAQAILLSRWAANSSVLR